MKLFVNTCRWICKGPFDLVEKMCLSCSTRLFWMNLFLLGKNLKTNMALAGKSNSWSCISYQKCWRFQPAMLVFWSATCSKHFWQLPSQVWVWEVLHIAQVILFSIAQNVHPKTTGGVARQTRTFTHDWPWSRRRSRFFQQSKKVGSWFFGSIFWDDISFCRWNKTLNSLLTKNWVPFWMWCQKTKKHLLLLLLIVQKSG